MFLIYKNKGFDDVEQYVLNWVDDFSLEGVDFDHEKESMSCVYESFCMEYEPEYDTFVFDDQLMICYTHPCLHPFCLLSLYLMSHSLVCFYLHLLN